MSSLRPGETVSHFLIIFGYLAQKGGVREPQMLKKVSFQLVHQLDADNWNNRINFRLFRVSGLS